MSTVSLVGSRLGKYQVLAEIGRGGMGTVYRAYDPTLDRPVAIKVLAPHLAWEGGFVERFLREARAAANLRHPCIVTIHDVGQAGSWYYYVMEYLDGVPLGRMIQQRGCLSPGEIASIVLALAGALDYAHTCGLVHRDIKPSNIIIGRAGRVTLTDFGIVWVAQEGHLTSAGSVLGSPAYMSPEQARGTPVEARSDQYSLAVVAYEMLCGRAPFRADNTMSLLYKVVHEAPPPIRRLQPGLPGAVEAVLAKALAKQPASRYPTLSAFAEALGQVLSRHKGPLVPARAPEPLPDAATVMLGAGPAAGPAARSGPPNGAPAALSAPEAGAGSAAAAPGRRVRHPVWLGSAAGLSLLALVVALALLKGCQAAPEEYSTTPAQRPIITVVVSPGTELTPLVTAPYITVVVSPGTELTPPPMPFVVTVVVPPFTATPPPGGKAPAQEVGQVSADRQAACVACANATGAMSADR